MKVTAIVYTSNTGFTAQYAGLLGEKTGLGVYSLEEAEKKLPSGSPILYLGWLAAGKVQGYDRAAKQFAVQAVCGVGMGATGSQNADIRKANTIPDGLPVFTLQGGFAPNQLHGIHKLMILLMQKTVGKSLEEKKKRTPDEQDLLQLLKKGGSRVREENLQAVLEWYRSSGM